MTPQDKKRLREAREAIARIEETMRQGDNRFGEYGRNCREAIKRHEAVLREVLGLKGEC